MLLLAALPMGRSASVADPPPTTNMARLEAAIANITLLDRPGQEGFATVWDGDK